MSFNVGPRTISATGGSIKRVGNYRVHTFPSELVSDGLVLNLDAGDPRSYPSSGTVWTDLSGNGNTGTLTNGPTYSNANGGSIAFTRASLHYVTASTSTVRTHGSNPFTLEAWARNTINGDYNTVLSTHGSSREIGFHQGYFMWGGNGGGGNTLIYSGSRNLNQWYHLVMTFDGLGGNIGKLYVDGVLLATGNIGDNGATSTSIVRVGSYATSGTEFLDGNVAIARVYNRALSAAEVAQNYDALKVRYTSYTNTFTPLCAGTNGKVEVLCVAGGGGGGGSGTSASGSTGGGGAGGLKSTISPTGGGGSPESQLSLTASTNYTVTVGGGGNGGSSGGANTGQTGTNSVFGSITSSGGGGGGGMASQVGQVGANGGSGGGGASGGQGGDKAGGTGTSGQGYAGGSSTSSAQGDSGGGGGAGAVGTKPAAGSPGQGGAGVSNAISGTSTAYAGGGAGGGQNAVGQGGSGGGGSNSAGTANTGGGGSGRQGASASGYAGGSGIVIVRYVR